MQKIAYRAATGVAEVNGQRVPVSGRIMLTHAEGLYDLAHGRIEAEVQITVAKPPRALRRKGPGNDRG